MDHRDRAWVKAWIRDGLAQLDGWKDLVEDLVRMGYGDEEVHDLLRPYRVWSDEAQTMKLAGCPFEEIIGHLRDLKAQPWDVVQALTDSGQSLADALRIVLPSLTESEGHLLVSHLLKNRESNHGEEVRAVLAYHGLWLE
ncbi:MAG: hypothetical protein JST24_05365 [Acidobacteria bacterium]|nr:hypothetical protein [Acidobacteriota bacterium]